MKQHRMAKIKIWSVGRYMKELNPIPRCCDRCIEETETTLGILSWKNVIWKWDAHKIGESSCIHFI